MKQELCRVGAAHLKRNGATIGAKSKLTVNGILWKPEIIRTAEIGAISAPLTEMPVDIC